MTANEVIRALGFNRYYQLLGAVSNVAIEHPMGHDCLVCRCASKTATLEEWRHLAEVCDA